MKDPRENMTDDEIDALEYAWFGKAILGLDKVLKEAGDFKSPVYIANLILKGVYEHSGHWSAYLGNLGAVGGLPDVVDSVFVYNLLDELHNVSLNALGEYVHTGRVLDAKKPSKAPKEKQDILVDVWLDGLTEDDVVGQPTMVLYAEYTIHALADRRKPMTLDEFYNLLTDKFGLREVVRQVGDGVISVYASR